MSKVKNSLQCRRPPLVGIKQRRRFPQTIIKSVDCKALLRLKTASDPHTCKFGVLKTYFQQSSPTTNVVTKVGLSQWKWE